MPSSPIRLNYSARSSIAWTICWIAVCYAFSSRTFAQGEIDFSHDVVPILKAHCSKCHAGQSKKGGFSLNTHEALLSGSENGPVIEAGKASESRLIDVIKSTVTDERMPPEGDRLSDKEIAILERWINQGAKWEAGFAFEGTAYEPPLKPRMPELPEPRNGRTNPIDRIIDHYLAQSKSMVPEPLDDAAFARRASLDLVGLLPEPEVLERYLSDQSADKRARYVDQLLANDMAYAEHWLTFWNDLLRNDYDGTGFITKGRSQISVWLYDSLIHNKPYDQFVRELIAPVNDTSRGFIDGIKWRGEVSAGQTVEIQFAQSISQSLLGINMKCASCHDSFIDRWKLEEAYGLAAIYANKPLDIYRCDKPIGRTATASWLFPEIGQVDPAAKQPERLKQLAALITHPDNGRFTRTMVNRLWHRMMGHGIVHPTDAMQTEPWNADLLDYLASDFAAHRYDLKHTLKLIASSAAYQSRCEVLKGDDNGKKFQYAGPRAKRMTAEQFIDTVWQLTNMAPEKMDAKFLRGKLTAQEADKFKVTAQWIWSSDGKPPTPAGEKRTFRKKFKLDRASTQAAAVITCDNQFRCFLNGKQIAQGDNWNVPAVVSLGNLKEGEHELLIVATNEGKTPNPAGLFFQATVRCGEDVLTIASDASWQWTASALRDDGKFAKAPDDWQDAQLIANQATWSSSSDELQRGVARTAKPSEFMVRASLLKSTTLMRTLGRPNRDQIVTMRPNDLSTLEAIDLVNGAELAKTLHDGAEKLVKRNWKDRSEFVEWLYRYSLSRSPSVAEREIAEQLIGESITTRGIEDLLWAIIMLPEYQLVR